MAKIAIIGCGMVGRAWAIAFARIGHGVALWDPMEEAPRQALDQISKLLPDLEAHDLLQGHGRAEVMARLRPVDTLDQALYGAEYVQECAPEQLAIKRDTFSWLDGIASPQTILASSSATLLPSTFTEGLAGRDRCLVAHPVDPPYLLPTVDLVPAPWTDPRVVARTRDFLSAADLQPVMVDREGESFVGDRLQTALLEEALRLLDEGRITAADLDAVIRNGLAPRWTVLGLFQSADLDLPGGLSPHLDDTGPATTDDGSVQAAAPARKTVAEQIRSLVLHGPSWGSIPDQQLWRDRRLMGMIERKRAIDGQREK